jgi:hypothetical protein
VTLRKARKISPNAVALLAGIDLVKERRPSGSTSISADEIQHFKGLVRHLWMRLDQGERHRLKTKPARPTGRAGQVAWGEA